MTRFLTMLFISAMASTVVATEPPPAPLLFGLEPVVDRQVVQQSFGLCVDGQCQVRQPVRTVAQWPLAAIQMATPRVQRSVSYEVATEVQQIVEYQPVVKYIEAETVAPVVTTTRTRTRSGLFARIRARFKNRSFRLLRSSCY